MDNKNQVASTNPTKPGGIPLQQGPNLSNLSKRLRMLEERYTKLVERIQLDEHNSMDSRKKTNVNVRTINSELDEIKSEIAEIKDRIVLIVKELKLTAKRDDVKVLKRYIEMWEPIDFVTRDELDKRIKELKEELRNNLEE